MDPDRWRQIEELYLLVLRQEPARQNRFLAEACQGDAELRREVESLLAQSGSTQLLVDQSAWAEAGNSAASSALTPGARLGPYQILGPLGEGGMGKVYRGLDTRLGRAVAIKISAEQFSKRFEHEARAISALNHPHICTLYDVGAMPSGSGYMVTELVEGETLRDWLKHAPAVERGIDIVRDIARQVLEALRAAHQAAIIHRDLKPANIMVRFDGYVKVLDFGLAKRIPSSGVLAAEDTVTNLSVPGEILGTVAYMSPEQIQGQGLDPRSDLFAFGIILYEMLAGAHPWPRGSTVDTLHAILHDQPPPIRNTAAVGLAGIVQKLLRKSPSERYSSAEAVLEALASRSAAPPPPTEELKAGERPGPTAPTRLIVLPFRLLRRHEASDFLAISLPDAITSSLAAIDSLVVRSPMVASRFATAELDVTVIAEQAQVDAILTGTILSDGEQLRVTSQLVDAPNGAVLWSNTSQVSLRDIFQLQDELVDRIVQSLKVPLTAREQSALKHDVPASAIAYELYLRANQLALAGYDSQNLILARDLYLRSLDEDPKYAPAWASLGRIYRLIGKYDAGDLDENLASAEGAFQKAFALNPDLALGHNFHAALQAEMGRSQEAMERLLKRAHAHRNDPNLFAGLVHACRYCGLLEASLAAHDLARRLDPHLRTTVVYSHFYLGNFQKALDLCGPGDEFVQWGALVALGRQQEAMELLAEGEKNAPGKQLKLLVVSYRAFLEGDRQKSLDALDQALKLAGPFRDPEGRFWTGRYLANLNQAERALEFLSLALNGGFRCHHALLHDPSLDSLRSHPRFTELVSRASEMDQQARTVFLDNGGDRLLGVREDRRPSGN